MISIHCLNYIEREVLSLKAITVDHLRRINACLTRLLFGSARVILEQDRLRGLKVILL